MDVGKTVFKMMRFLERAYSNVPHLEQHMENRDLKALDYLLDFALAASLFDSAIVLFSSGVRMYCNQRRVHHNPNGKSRIHRDICTDVNKL